MQDYILALDQGTTSSRALLFDHDFRLCGMEQMATRSYFPETSWVEQDALEIWKTQLEVAKRLVKSHASFGKVRAIGIANQRESVVVWDRHSGVPVYPAIIWQDKRTAEYCKEISNPENDDFVRSRTGLVIDPYFSAAKIKWILDHVEDGRERAESGRLLAGTIDSWLIWNLSGGALHVTDPSNASRTLLYNIHKGDWDPELLDFFQIPQVMLPRLVNSSENLGHCSKEFFGEEIPISGLAGDQQAALFGQTCFEAGMAKNTYGTGCFLLMNTGGTIPVSKSGLLSTVAWGIDGQLSYALEGSVFIAGALMQWLRDELGFFEKVGDTESMCREAGDNKGVYFVPAFSGLGAPWWDMNAKGLICGLTQGVEKKHIVRAAVESMAYQSLDVLKAMQNDSGICLKELNVDGGATVNNFLMQFQSDLLGIPLSRPQLVESTALGAAMLAGLAAGFWKTEDFLMLKNKRDVFNPAMDALQRESLYTAWLKAVARARS